MRILLLLILGFMSAQLSACITTPVIEAVNAAEKDTAFPADEIAKLVNVSDAEFAFNCSYTLNEATDATFAAGGPGGQFRFVDPEDKLVIMAQEFVYGAKIYDQLVERLVGEGENNKFDGKKLLQQTGLNHYGDFRSIPAKEKAFLSDIKECMAPISRARLMYNASSVGVAES